MRALLSALFACSTAGCPGPPDDPRCGAGRRPSDVPDDVETLVPLIAHDAWVQVDAPDDPLAEHRPATVECGSLGWQIDPDGFEIDTAGCNYMAAIQPIREELCAGDTLHFDFQHYNLVTSDPAQAHVTIRVGELEILNYTVDIDPEFGAAARKWDENMAVDLDVPAGAAAYLHVHNHGFNDYKLLALDVVLGPGD